MRQILRVLISLVAVAVFSSGGSTAEAPKKAEPKTENQLVGTWKMVKAKYGGKESPIPEGRTEFKHVTPVHFTLVAFDKDGIVLAAIGGPYTLKGDQYEETPAYGLSEVFTGIKGKPQSFTWKVEGNRWYHNGTISSGLTIEEVWERVEKN